jgi:hypothetical protein
MVSGVGGGGVGEGGPNTGAIGYSELGIDCKYGVRSQHNRLFGLLCTAVLIG